MRKKRFLVRLRKLNKHMQYLGKAAAYAIHR